MSRGPYSLYKAFHYPEKLRNLMQGEVVAPIHVRIKPYNRCNHSCFYCCYLNEKVLGGDLYDARDMIEPEKMLEIIDDLAEMGVKGVILTGGGEPLIYPGIKETIAHIKKREIDLGVITNGSNLKDEVAELLADANWVRISLDAARDEIFREIRGTTKGEFDRIVRNIADFVRLRQGCKVAIYYNVNHKNFEGVYDFLGVMSACKVDNVKITECVIGSAAEDYEYHRPFVRRVRGQVERAKRDLGNGGMEIIDHYGISESMAEENREIQKEMYRKEYDFCPTMHLTMSIGADLGVYSCHDKAYTQSGLLGYIKDRGFKDFWFSEENRNRMRHMRPSAVCNHHCANHARNVMLNQFMDIEKEHLSFL